MIKEIAFTAYPAKDVAGLRKWYEDNLGLKFSGPYEEDGVEKYNEANIGSGTFSVLWQGWAIASRAARPVWSSKSRTSINPSPIFAQKASKWRIPMRRRSADNVVR